MIKIFGTIAYWIAWPLQFMVLRNSRRTRILVTAGDEVLLVKNLIDHGNLWTLPGGGVKGSETDKVCAQRELKEEVNCFVDTNDLRLLEEGPYKSKGIKYTAVYFAVNCEKRREVKKGFEITEIDWFPVKNLPKNRKPSVDQAVSKL